MAKRTVKDQTVYNKQPPPKVYTPEEKLKMQVTFMKKKLEGYVARANEIRQNLIEKIGQDNGEALYQISWLESKPKDLYLGAFAEEILKDLEGKSDEENVAVLRKYEERIKGMKNEWYPQSSSSAYSNAVNNERYNAMVEILSWGGLSIHI